MIIIIKKVTGAVTHYIVEAKETYICHTLDEVFTLMRQLFGEEKVGGWHELA